jgi:FADH2-dependent halogenase
MSSTDYDVIIIGCGPGGSSAATFLARAGRRVLVLEKEIFPRFHIGESLLPCNQTILREMGVLPELQKSDFPRKFGAQFCLGNGTINTRFIFGDGKFNREPETFQVERARFDHILLKHARSCGAEIREGWQVTRFTPAEDSVTVEANSPDGQPQKFTAKYLIDSSGRGNVTGNQEGTREIDPKLKKLALFGHYHNVRLDEGSAGGDTIIVRLENKWFWIIPVSSDKTSVGLVIDKDEFSRTSGTPEEIFKQWIASSPVIAERMANAELIDSMKTTSDFSYHNRSLTGPRWLRVGDAAGFMDPIFSAGIFLAMWSGKISAEILTKKLKNGAPGGRAFTAYEKRVKRGLRFYWRVVENYYTTPFMELFLQPRNHFDLPSAVSAVLAGELEGGFALRWRLEYFFLLVKLQKRWPLVPHISFAPVAPMKKSCAPRATTTV